MAERSIALLSGSGGTGKTVAALTIGGRWAERGAVTLVDTDPKDAGSSSDWLDRATPKPADSWQWAKADRSTLLATLDTIAGPVIVDTAAGLDSAQTIEIADAVDAVLVTGSVDEMREIVQAARTVKTMTNTPVAAVLTRTKTATDRSGLGLAARAAIEASEIELLGSLRDFATIARQKLAKGLPSRVTDQRVIDDGDALTEAVDRWLTKVAG